MSEKQKFSLNKNNYAIRRWKDKDTISFKDAFHISNNANNSYDFMGYPSNSFGLHNTCYNSSNMTQVHKIIQKLQVKKMIDF